MLDQVSFKGTHRVNGEGIKEVAVFSKQNHLRDAAVCFNVADGVNRKKTATCTNSGWPSISGVSEYRFNEHSACPSKTRRRRRPVDVLKQLTQLQKGIDASRERGASASFLVATGSTSRALLSGGEYALTQCRVFGRGG